MEENQVASYLHQSTQEILGRWEAEVRKQIPAARAETKSALRDSIPEFLKDLIRALQTNFAEQKADLNWFAHKHGSERANASSYSIEDAITEYNILRRVIFGVLEDKVQVSTRERDIIYESISLGLAKAGAEYAKTQIHEVEAIVEKLHNEQDLRDKFISTLSHDLRTPLTASKMSAQIIARKIQDPQIHTLTTRIADNIDRADKLIQDLLDASRIRAGKMVLPRVDEFNLVGLLNMTLEDLTTIHGDRFQVTAPDRLMTYLNPEGIRRVIENLCSNAIKYGSLTDFVKISLTPDKDHFELSVHNTGNPLILVDKKKLFEPFEQGSSARIGWGIGLTIVKGISEAHGGKVRVDSDERGTTFTVRLPVDARPLMTQHLH